MNELPQNVSESVRRLNPHLYRTAVAGLRPAVPQHARHATAPRADGAQAQGPRRVVVSIVSFRRIRLDDDNLVGGCKALRDAIAKSLGLDDGDKRIWWEYSQHIGDGQRGTLVKIEWQ